MADRFQDSIEVNASAAECYACWRNLENFPQFMDHVKEVRQDLDDRQFHWVVEGPMGKTLEWDAVVDGDEPGKLISWHTVSDPEVGVQGAVRFDEMGADRCRVTVTMQYEPPAGPIGEAVAKLFANPERMVQEDLRNFKELVEGGNFQRYSGEAVGTAGGSYPDSGDIGGVGGNVSGTTGMGTPGTDVNPPNQGRY